MHVRAVDGRRELRVGVELRLPGPPVVAVPPVLGQLADADDRHAIAHVATGRFGRPAHACEAIVQVGEVLVRDCDAVRAYLVHRGVASQALGSDVRSRYDGETAPH
jgi:hypothetical protein